MHLDLTDAESLALLNLQTETIENDRYPSRRASRPCGVSSRSSGRSLPHPAPGPDRLLRRSATRLEDPERGHGVIGDREQCAKSLPAITRSERRDEPYSSLTRWSARIMSPAMASVAPLRYPIPNPTVQPATPEPTMTRQIRAASSAQATAGSEKRNSQVICLERKDPTTSRPASRAVTPDAIPRRSLGLPA